MTGTTDALEGDGNRTRRTQLNDEIDRADVDAELERRSSSYRAQLAATQTPFDVEAKLAGETAVMRHDESVAEALVERERDALAHAARTNEDQRGAVIANLLGDAVVDFAPHLLTRHRSELVGGNDNVQIHRAAVSDVDDERLRAEEPGNLLDRADGGRKPDPLGTAPTGTANQLFQARQRQSQMRTALIAGHGVDLIDDDGRHAREKTARTFRR